MFRLIKLVITLSVGAVLGFYFNGMLMRAECSSAEGQWTGTICISEGVSQ
jgi:hypothetical protein